jgi:N-methylhydantoinase A
VLGYLDPAYFLGGEMQLDPAAARAAVGRLAQELGISLERGADAILAVAGEHMVQAIKEMTINEGVDPRETVIVAGGGAAGINIVQIARELGCRRVLVPATAGALSACGAQYSDIVAEFSVSRFTTSGDFDYEQVNHALAGVDGAIAEFGAGLIERGFARSRTDYFVEARYPYQVWDLEVPLARGRFDGGPDVDALVRDFHAAHERIFAVKELGQQVECVHWKGRLTVTLDRPPFLTAAGNGGRPEPHQRRTAFFREGGEATVPAYRGGELRVGASIEGPAIIHEPTTTIVLYPQSMATVTPLGDYLLEVAG